MNLRPVLIAESAWRTLSESQRDQIAIETVERLPAYPELCRLLGHQLRHAAEMLRRGPLTTAQPPVRALRFAFGRGAPR